MFMINSFKYAFRGIKDAIRSERNLSVHLLFGLIAAIFAYFLNFTKSEFAILTLTISFVIILELINTIVEKLVDMHSTKVSEEARVIKDISAAIVLLGAITSVIIGLFLFVSKLL